MKKALLTIFILFQTFLFSQVYGQLGNYWTLQVSTEGTLLSGALVAANSNNAGFFYNPASMSSDSSSSFSLNTSLFRTYFLNYKNPFGEGTKLEDITGYFDPIFLSFLIPRKNKLNVKLGVSLMAKQNTNFKILNRIYLPNYNFPQDTLNGDYEGSYTYVLKSSENWINFSASKQLSEVFSIGATFIIAYRSLNYINNLNSSYVYVNKLDKNTTASYTNNVEAYMYNYKILGKIGVIFNLNEYSRIGLNLTTSSLNVYGRGTLQRSIGKSNILSLEYDSTVVISNDQLLSDYSAGLKANFKSPFSIALGYNLESGNYKFGFAVEYFNEINPYNLISGAENGTLINTTNSDITETEALSLKFGQRSIVNFAISYEQKLNEKFTILSGFRTNFSTSKDVNYTESDINTYIKDIDINVYHITGGSTFTLLRNQFILGVDLGLSFHNKQDNIVNYSSPLIYNNQNLPLQGNIENNTKISFVMLGFVLGYSFNF